MSTVRVDNIENIEGSVDIDVRDIQVSYEALVNKGEYREGLIFRKYQESFIREGRVYIPKKGFLPFSLTGDWTIDVEKVRVFGSIDIVELFESLSEPQINQIKNLLGI